MIVCLWGYATYLNDHSTLAHHDRGGIHPTTISHGRASHRRVPTGVHLMGVYLINVHLMGVYLINVHLTGLHFMGVHLIGLHFIGVYLIARTSWVCTS